ncbi:hypothetical protein S40285_09238 [Stachybotrys chlorohalonatus IBT 40285]|uniref:Phosphate transporter n=1 Tax=Stachybotrys chlorohalonatus (strain IBT 40285) TaxID=1283841 RepID=A0A084QW42_STAC4|nr:hypothetical protein S40285_09238 [Stachybotrys chlorohalonata IBT 40285]
MPLHQYDYILAIGLIFAFLDAWNIGANDVANSWATSVSSRSLTYVQAMTLASILEFTGAVGVGNRVAQTIRTNVVPIEAYEGRPTVLMLGMACAIVASSTWLTIATRLGLPVSTTHSIMGGVIGMGIATIGAQQVNWADFSGGVAGGVVQVFLGWIAAPGIAGSLAAITFLLTKYAVMVRKDPVVKGLIAVPIFIGITSALIIMLLIWDGGSIDPDLTGDEQAGVIVGGGAAAALLATLTLIPWLYRKILKNDWQLRWYHIFMGPLLLRRPEPPVQPEDYAGGIRDFYRGHMTREELDALRAEEARSSETAQGVATETVETDSGRKTVNDVAETTVVVHEGPNKDEEYPTHGYVGPRPEGPVYSPRVVYWFLKLLFLSGVDKDIVALQSRKTGIAKGLEDVHAAAIHFDNRAEYLFTYMQVMTACATSFAHGANDVANAIAPLATIYDIWRTGSIAGSRSPVPVWILVFGGAAIALGCWTYGYRVMSNLGNRLTLHSPVRGFSMELGTVSTIIMATQLELPISTTQTITGAIVGVGLCSGTWRSINWRMIAWIYGGWIITLPCAGILSGCLTGIVLNAPRWGLDDGTGMPA